MFILQVNLASFSSLNTDRKAHGTVNRKRLRGMLRDAKGIQTPNRSNLHDLIVLLQLCFFCWAALKYHLNKCTLPKGLLSTRPETASTCLIHSEVIKYECSLASQRVLGRKKPQNKTDSGSQLGHKTRFHLQSNVWTRHLLS